MPIWSIPYQLYSVLMKLNFEIFKVGWMYFELYSMERNKHLRLWFTLCNCVICTLRIISFVNMRFNQSGPVGITGLVSSYCTFFFFINCYVKVKENRRESLRISYKAQLKQIYSYNICDNVRKFQNLGIFNDNEPCLILKETLKIPTFRIALHSL